MINPYIEYEDDFEETNFSGHPGGDEIFLEEVANLSLDLVRNSTTPNRYSTATEIGTNQICRLTLPSTNKDQLYTSIANFYQEPDTWVEPSINSNSIEESKQRKGDWRIIRHQTFELEGYHKRPENYRDITKTKIKALLENNQHFLNQVGEDLIIKDLTGLTALIASSFNEYSRAA